MRKTGLDLTSGAHATSHGTNRVQVVGGPAGNERSYRSYAPRSSRNPNGGKPGRRWDEPTCARKIYAEIHQGVNLEDDGK